MIVPWFSTAFGEVSETIFLVTGRCVICSLDRFPNYRLPLHLYSIYRFAPENSRILAKREIVYQVSGI